MGPGQLLGKFAGSRDEPFVKAMQGAAAAFLEQQNFVLLQSPPSSSALNNTEAGGSSLSSQTKWPWHSSLS